MFSVNRPKQNGEQIADTLRWITLNEKFLYVFWLKVNKSLFKIVCLIGQKLLLDQMMAW